jgi:hypothetical protein
MKKENNLVQSNALRRGGLLKWGIPMLFLIALLSVPQTAHADEGGLQIYVPGVYGSLRLALVPGPGLYYLNLAGYGSIGADIVPNGGKQWLDLDMWLLVNSFTPVYVTDWKLFGGTYFLGAGVPIVYYNVNAKAVEGGTEYTPGSPLTSFGLSDIYAIPIGLSWQSKEFHVFIYEGINVPVGKYSLGDPQNIGLNHWSFDTNIGFTWMFPNSPLELDIDLGYTIHTTNTATDYKSGNSVHLDYTLGYDFSEPFAAGISGYYYKQVTGDSGTGATLGDFKGMGVGIGASATYTFSMDPIIALTVEWIHDLETENRFKGDWVTALLAVQL